MECGMMQIDEKTAAVKVATMLIWVKLPSFSYAQKFHGAGDESSSTACPDICNFSKLRMFIQ
jgi:hypothetical protein